MQEAKLGQLVEYNKKKVADTQLDELKTGLTEALATDPPLPEEEVAAMVTQKKAEQKLPETEVIKVRHPCAGAFRKEDTAPDPFGEEPNLLPSAYAFMVCDTQKEVTKHRSAGAVDNADRCGADGGQKWAADHVSNPEADQGVQEAAQ